MGFLKEFREFALRGNVLDLAVAVIIGVAFGGIVNSFIADIIMPVVSIPGKADFSNLYVPLNAKAAAAIDAADVLGAPLTLADARAAGPVLAYGSFLTVAINFVILAFCVFLVVKAFNTARQRFESAKPVPPPAGPTVEEKLLMEIRDLLAQRR